MMNDEFKPDSICSLFIIHHSSLIMPGSAQQGVRYRPRLFIETASTRLRALFYRQNKGHRFGHGNCTENAINDECRMMNSNVIPFVHHSSFIIHRFGGEPCPPIEPCALSWPTMSRTCATISKKSCPASGIRWWPA